MGGFTGMFKWDGKCLVPLKTGYIENKPIDSIVEAVITARQVIEKDELIQPCEQVVDRRVIRCPYMDPTGQGYCTYGEGYLPKVGSGVECPKQDGDIHMIKIVDK